MQWATGRPSVTPVKASNISPVPAPVVVVRAGCPFIFNDGVLRRDAEQRREERVAVLLRFYFHSPQHDAVCFLGSPR